MTPASFAPTGVQYELRHGEHRAIVTEVGATLRAYEVNGVRVVDGFPVEEMSSAGRGQVLAPWPNRLEDGRYEFEGRRGRAPINEPERGNAIHGLVRWLPWSVTQRSAAGVTLACTVAPQPAYPWRLALSVTYTVDESGLSVTARATNETDVAAPFAIGFHPYLAAPATIDDATLTVPARVRLVTDDRSVPTGSEPVEGTGYDFSDARTIGEVQLDTAFGDLWRDGDGLARVGLAPAGRPPASVWLDEAFRYVQIYTGDTLDPAERRRRGVAIEPMTSPANAFRSGVDLVRLESEETWRGSWGLAPEPST